MVEGRKRLTFTPRSAPYFTAQPANFSSLLFVPVMAHLWKQKELKDGTYSYIDLLDILEAINVENENKWRDYEHEKNRRQMHE